MKGGPITLVEVNDIHNILRRNSQLKKLCDFSHNTKLFLTKTQELPNATDFHIGNIIYEKSYSDILQISKSGLCFKGHPSSIVASERAVLINTFTTVKGNVLPKAIEIVSNKDFIGLPRKQGYNYEGLILPKDAIKNFSPLPHEDIKKEFLFKALQEYIKKNGETSIRVDLLQMLNDFYKNK